MMRPGHRHWPKVWYVLIALDTFVEVWALRGKRREATLSHFTRRTFRTHHPVGRAVFAGAWIALSAWFVPHVCRCPDDPK